MKSLVLTFTFLLAFFSGFTQQNSQTDSLQTLIEADLRKINKLSAVVDSLNREWARLVARHELLQKTLAEAKMETFTFWYFNSPHEKLSIPIVWDMNGLAKTRGGKLLKEPRLASKVLIEIPINEVLYIISVVHRTPFGQDQDFLKVQYDKYEGFIQTESIIPTPRIKQLIEQGLESSQRLANK